MGRWSRGRRQLGPFPAPGKHASPEKQDPRPPEPDSHASTQGKPPLDRYRIMSIHIDLTPEAVAALHRQKRNSTFVSMTIAALMLVLAALIFALVMIAPLQIERPEILVYASPALQEQQLEKPTVRLPQTRPSAPSASAVSKVIAAATVSPVAVPNPYLEVDSPAIDFGDSLGFGPAWGDTGHRTAGGSSSGFGSTQAIAGGLRGRLYDFKKDERGRPVPGFDPAALEPYAAHIERIQRSGFSSSALRRFFQAPQELFLTQLAIPLSDAREGPRFFNAENDIEPRGWMAHYQGRIVSPRDITFRFAGRGDDYLAVYVDGRPRLHASWPSLNDAVRGRWEPARGTIDQHDSGLGATRLIYGDWITLKAGQEVKLDIGLGERPGGHVGFILLVEERGVDHRQTADGRPILPLFTTRPISDEVRKEITVGFKNYPIEWDRVPVFPAR
jgi:hypothetical protein